MGTGSALALLKDYSQLKVMGNVQSFKKIEERPFYSKSLDMDLGRNIVLMIEPG